MYQSTARTASLLAAATAAIFLLLLGVALTQGITQQYFELVHSPERYTQQLVAHAGGLQAILVLDNLFIILYTGLMFFTIHTLRRQAPGFVAVVAFVLMGTVAVLDFTENFHIYTLLQQAKAGIMVLAADIRWQAAESMLKWHLAYAAFFMLGFLLPRHNGLAKLLRYCLWYWFVPTGILLFAFVDTVYEPLFQWIRYLNLLSGFVLLLVLMRKLAGEASPEG